MTSAPATGRLGTGFGPRGLVLGAIGIAGVWAAARLGLDLRDLVPNAGGLRIAGEFFSRAFSPALGYESSAATDAPPLLLKAFAAANTTLIFAGAAVSLALTIGLPLGFLSSSRWWSVESGANERLLLRALRLGVAPAIWATCRMAIALMRSVHELIWAVLFLAAFGLSDLSAVIAIAIPYGGTFAKVFSELLDEAPREAAEAMRAGGASTTQVFLFGLLPRAAPDMVAYTFYRFECALRSSAILGFFGYPTLGYYVLASFENLHYGEVWTYLYTLFLLVLAADVWSGQFRRRFVA